MGIKDFLNRKNSIGENGSATQYSGTTDAIESAKTKFDWSNLQETMKSLDVNNVADWPLFAKLGAAIFVAVVVNIVAFALLTNGVRADIANGQVEEARLLQNYKELDSKVRKLSSYEQQFGVMELEFNQLLDKLPRVINVPDLVEEINVAGVRSGIRFKSILVKPEQANPSVIELPVDIEAVGDYHGFGAFVSEIASLSRIITLHDFAIKAESIDSKGGKSGIPVLTFNALANTYRYNDAPSEDKVSANKKGASREKN